ncbi:Sec-independent protein translocase protein TatB [Aliiroseovarius sp. YM-037]|uniref:Sec-independent protein translocase protein TatB n=1 Tax=Aliiroseovarius sp. YM-037 TaxID=3341728 RepID=UPI003A8013B2
MFDIGWTELLVIGIVALIVVGPKDLPGMFRTLGQFTGKAKAMARDFQRAMNEAADEAGVKDVQDTLRSATNPKAMGLDALKDATTGDWVKDPTGEKSAEKKLGPETAKLAAERSEAAAKIREATAKKATERKAAEDAAKSDGGAKAKPAKKPAAKKAPAKTATKTAAKSAAKKPAAKKPAAKKPAAKAAAKKPTTAKKPAAKKPASKAKPKDGAA